MDTRIIKVVIALGLLAWSIQQFVTGNIGYGIMLALAAIILGLLFFRSVRLIVVFWNLRQQKQDKARAWLSRINPEKMWKRQEAYYYFLSGLTNLDTSSMSQSEKTFKKALSIGLKMDHDKAVAKLNLAQISAAKRRKREALNLLAEVKKLDKRNMLREQVKMIKDAMKRL